MKFFAEIPEVDSKKRYFIIMAIGVQVFMLVTYILFFLLILRETVKGREFEDLILHKRVPELVYL